MNILLIVATFILAYAVFMTATYFLAKVFFPMEDMPVKERAVRRVVKQTRTKSRYSTPVLMRKTAMA